MSRPVHSLDFAAAQDEVGPPPTRKGASQEVKRKYSERLSAAFSRELERSLEGLFPGITSGAGEGTPSDTAFGLKSFDVSWTLRGLGLAFGISVKTVGVGEVTPNGRWHYTHNYKRTAEEWTLETLVYHRFQPYASIVGILFLPFDASHDRTNVTSLAAATKKFADFQGRTDHRDDPEIMERIYVGLYDADGTARGRVRFWDVADPLGGTEQPPEDAYCDLERLAEDWQALVRSRIRGYKF